MDKYVLVCWPESQMLMGMEWFNECILMNDIDHLAEIGSSAYFVPADRYLGLTHSSNDVVIDYATKGTPDGNIYTTEAVFTAGEMGDHRTTVLYLLYL